MKPLSNILTINAGSSSIKYKVFLHQDKHNTLILSGLIEGIGESNGNWHHQYHSHEARSHSFMNHQEAFSHLAIQLKQDLTDFPIHGVGHRVVHGGNTFYQPTIINDEVLTGIDNLKHLAPLHNPINASGIRYAEEHFPNAIHVAIFDTAFHHGMPKHASHYAIDAAVAEQYQIQRYGFHGINHEYVTTAAAKFLNKPLSQSHFISLHLGNGASACLVKNGQSIDTTMGMTPLAGLIMGTRCGDIDPAIPIYLLQQGFDAQAINTLLNQQSGLKGIVGENDMRHILARMDLMDSNAILAIDMYVYAIQKMIGAYLSQISELDALILTGGVGENASVIREKILSPLRHFGFNLDESLNHQRSSEPYRNISTHGTPILVIRSDEESLIADKTSSFVSIASTG